MFCVEPSCFLLTVRSCYKHIKLDLGVPTFRSDVQDHLGAVSLNQRRIRASNFRTTTCVCHSERPAPPSEFAFFLRIRSFSVGRKERRRM